MDDLNQKRMNAEANKILLAAAKPMAEIGNLSTSVKLPTLDAELSKRLGVEDLNLVDVNDGMFWAGVVIGKMASHEISAADCHRVLHAVATVGWKEQYDVCGIDDSAEQIEAVPHGCDVEHRYSVNDLYRWARFFRVAVNEIAFGLEDHFHDPKTHPISALFERAVATVGFMIDTFHPAYSRTLGS